MWLLVCLWGKSRLKTNVATGLKIVAEIQMREMTNDFHWKLWQEDPIVKIRLLSGEKKMNFFWFYLLRTWFALHDQKFCDASIQKSSLSLSLTHTHTHKHTHTNTHTHTHTFFSLYLYLTHTHTHSNHSILHSHSLLYMFSFSHTLSIKWDKSWRSSRKWRFSSYQKSADSF